MRDPAGAIGILQGGALCTRAKAAPLEFPARKQRPEPQDTFKVQSASFDQMLNNLDAFEVLDAKHAGVTGCAMENDQSSGLVLAQGGIGECGNGGCSADADHGSQVVQPLLRGVSFQPTTKINHTGMFYEGCSINSGWRQAPIA